MGQDAADALDLREAQVLADPDGQRVEPPQDQPGVTYGVSAARPHTGPRSRAARPASQEVPSTRSLLSTQSGGQGPWGWGLQRGQTLPQPWLPGVVPSSQGPLPVQQDLDGEPLVSVKTVKGHLGLQNPTERRQRVLGTCPSPGSIPAWHPWARPGTYGRRASSALQAPQDSSAGCHEHRGLS